MPRLYDEIGFWERRMESLEKQRKKFTQLAAWSSDTIQQVETIDGFLKECEEELDRLFSEVDYLEYAYD